MLHRPAHLLRAAALAVALPTALAAAPAVPALARPILAQPPAGGGGGGARLQQLLFAGITLTGEQQARVDSIRGAWRERMVAGGGMGPGAPRDSAAMAGRRRLMEEQWQALRGVLTPEQQRVFDGNLQRLRDRMPGRGGPGGAPPR